jgi:two-component system sensor histidine kinase KdpD
VNYFSTAPVGTLTISDPQNVLALLVFVGVSTAVALVVDRSARGSKEAARARVEAVTLSELARGSVRSDDSVTALLEQAVDVFQVRGAALFTADEAGGGPSPRSDTGWRCVAFAGEEPPESPTDGENVEQVDATTVLVLAGRTLPASDRRLLGAFAAHLTALRERHALDVSRRENLRLAEGNTMRTAILRAVSHDLRTPLTGIKLAVSSLRQTGIRFTPDEEQEMLATIEDYTDRLDQLVGNLLDMSRITSDAAKPLLRPVRWYEVLPAALRGVPAGTVRVDLAPNLPEVDADAGMLERVIANVVENAFKYAPDSDIVIVGSAGGLGGTTIDGRPTGELRIIDHGQGVPAENVVAMFRPFQRLDDVPSTTGVGLGLAVAKGFVETMGGILTAEPTPGGGLTMVIRLPLSTGAPCESTPDTHAARPQSGLKPWTRPELHPPGEVKNAP